MREADFTNHPDAANALGRGINKPLTNGRRGSERCAMSQSIEVCGESPFNPQTYRGTTRDISAKGVYFVCGEAYMKGQLVHVTISLSGGLIAGSDTVSLTMRCRVQRVEEISQNGSRAFGVAVALDE
jgi:PilZ domain-containing protein